MNKNNPHTVFQTRANYGDWDKYIEQIDLIKLSKKQRQNFRESVGFLRVLFGENYLKRCLRDHHPFMSQMMNAVPVARLEFIKFAQSVKDLTDCPGINKLVKKFTRTKLAVEYIEALTVLESAHSFYKAGFSLEIEPEIEVQLPSGESRKKYPDLKLTNPQNNEEIFVEVSQLKVSDNEINSTATYTKIWREVHNSIDEHTVVRHDNSEKAPVFHHNILPYVKILRAFEPEELNRVVEEINEIITLALKTQTFQELILKDQIEMAVAPAHEHAQARGWAQSRNLKDFVEGPPIPLRDTQRARIKIAEKMKQLPENLPGIIIIPFNPLNFYAVSVDYIIADIESELLKFPQLLSVSLYSQVMEERKEKKIEKIGNHFFIQSKSSNFIAEKRILIQNSHFKHDTSQQSLKKIIKAFGI